MSKKTISFIVIFIALLLAIISLPYGIGLVIDSWVKESVEQFNDRYSGYYQIEIKKRNLGWLSSKIKTSLHVANNKDANILFTHEISHVPSLESLATIISVPIFKDNNKKILAYYFGDNQPFSIKTKIGYDRTYVSRLAVKSFDMPIYNDPETRIEWGGVKGEISGLLKREAKFHFEMPVIRIYEEKGQISLRDVLLDANVNFEKIDQKNAIGQLVSSINIDQVILDLKNTGDFYSIRKFRVAYKQNRKNEFADALTSYSSKSIDVDSVSSGLVQLHLSDVECSIKYGHLNIGVVKEYAKNVAHTFDLRLDVDRRQRLINQLAVDMYDELFKYSPFIEVKNISFRSGNGLANVTGKVNFDGDGFSGFSVEGGKVLNRINTEISISLPRNLAKDYMVMILKPDIVSYIKSEKIEASDHKIVKITESYADQRMEEFLKKGYIKKDGPNYKATLHIIDGKYAINGIQIQ